MKDFELKYRNLDKFEDEMKAMSPEVEKALDEIFSEKSSEASWIQPTMKSNKDLVEAAKLAIEDIKEKGEVTVVIVDGELKKLLEFFYMAADTDKEIYFLGDNLSTLEYGNAVKAMETKDFNVIAISSGNESTELVCAFTLARKELLNKSDLDKAQENVYVIAPKGSSYFMKEAAENKYVRLHYQEGIKSPEWLMTPAVLFPLGIMGYDIKDFVEAYESMVTNLIWDADGSTLAGLSKLLKMQGNGERYAHFSETEFAPLIEYIKYRTNDRYLAKPEESTMILDLSVEEPNRDVMTPPFPGCHPEGLIKFMAEDSRKEYLEKCSDKKLPVVEIRIKDFKAKSLGQLIYFLEMSIALENRLI
ncbi:MAG: hypothetical protein JJE03_07060 [Peptostreptococcaceae bacterium]|nr:hypothetical protein [Peptostreptococcaceae bacterium]